MAPLPLVLALALLTGSPNVQADTAGGIAAFKAGDHGLALGELQAPAEAGDPAAQFYLGVLYAQGWGTLADPTLARAWFEKSAAQGFAKAEHNLGVMFLRGEGVPPDPVAARDWLEKAAAHGSARSAQQLGLM